MVGVPKSLRCQGCKRRKVKCDEAWPTCGSCRRAGCECSGPPQTLIRFVSRETTNDHDKATSPTERQHPKGTMVAARSLVWKKITQSHTPPRQVSANRDSLLAAELVTFLTNGEGTGYDLRFVGDSIKAYPQILAGSAALQDALQCLLVSYKSVQRNERAEALIEPRSYGKALYSLHSAYQDPTLRYSVGTVAANEVMEWLGVTCGVYGSTDYGITHSVGMYAWVAGRGPPPPDNDFDNALYLEAVMFALQATLFRNLPPFFSRDYKWIEPFHRAIRNSTDPSGTTAWLYQVKIQMLQWPYLVQSVRRLHEGKPGGPSAPDLLTEAIAVAQDLQTVDVSFISMLKLRNDIREVDAPDSFFPYSWAYDFANHTTAQLFVWHSMFSIVVNRVIEQLVFMVKGETDPAFEVSIREWSRRIWLSYDFAHKSKPLRNVYFFTPLCALLQCFEVGNAEERACVIEAFHDMMGHRKPEGSRRMTEEDLMYSARASTGRAPFIWPSNKIK